MDRGLFLQIRACLLGMLIVTMHKVSTSTRWHFAFALSCHSNETCAPIANLHNSIQSGAPSTILPSYIRVRAVVWACGQGQTDRHTQTDARDQYTFRVVYDSSAMQLQVCIEWLQWQDLLLPQQSSEPSWHSIIVQSTPHTTSTGRQWSDVVRLTLWGVKKDSSLDKPSRPAQQITLHIRDVLTRDHRLKLWGSYILGTI